MDDLAGAADAALTSQQFVTPIDVLVGLGWLDTTKVDAWRKGAVTSLDRCIRAEPLDVTEALKALGRWALDRDLRPWDTDYGDLAFTADSNPQSEHASRIRWALTEDPAPKPPRRSPHPKLLAAALYLDCKNCGTADDLILNDKAGGVCVDCAGLGHLVFLPSGDTALTRHITKAAPFSAVVMRMNTRRMRHERQGILTDQRSIELAAAQCLAEPARSQGRGVVDDKLRRHIAHVINDGFPGCPPARADAIAYHAAVRGRGRHARSEATDPDSIRRAVECSVRRIDTEYDDLSLAGLTRSEAERRTQDCVDDILETWHSGVVLLDAKPPTLH